MSQRVSSGALEVAVRPRIVTFGTVLAVHAVLIAGALSFRDVARVEAIAVPMEVRMMDIPPAQPVPAAPHTTPATRQAPTPATPLHPVHSGPPQNSRSEVPQPTAAATNAEPIATAVAAAPSVPARQAEDAVSPSGESRHELETAARFDADYLHNPAPVYSPAARRAGEEGRVLLLVRVSPQGEADSVQIRQSSGFTRLDEASQAAVRQWRFVPARQGGEAIAASVLVPITFRLGR